MSLKKLSIVIPSYNMEALLARCVESICQPSIVQDIEVIIVNDGSKDNTLGVAKILQEKFSDSNSIVVVDKPNGNYGSCVNKGLSIATGTYFRIIDADDCVDANGIVRLMQHLKHSDSDLIITNYVRENSFKNKRQYINLDNKNIDFAKTYTIDEIDIFKDNLRDNFVMHTMTFKTSVLRAKPLYHQEKISYTDTEYCYYPMDKVNTIEFVNTLLYRYQLGRDGQTMSKASFMKSRDHMFMILDRALNDDFDLQSLEGNGRKKIKASILLSAFSFYYYIILCHVGYTIEDDKKIKSLDSRLKKSSFLYEELGKYKVMGYLPIVANFRKKGHYSNGFPFKQMYYLSNLLKF